MDGESVSFVRAVKNFFESEPFGRRVSIEEFQALTESDREDLRNLLLAEGINVRPLGAVA